MAVIFCDESGNFGDASDHATFQNIVGGIVAPEHDVATSSRRWRECFTALYELHGFGPPPHAADLDEPIRAAFVEQAVQQVRETGGCWVFVRAPSAQRDTVPLSRYLRTLEAWVDLSARVVRARGAGRVDVHVAQRSVPLVGWARDDAERAETGVPSVSHEELLRVLVRPGIHTTMAQLTQEGGIQLGELGIESASSANAHIGLHMCDLGCSAVRSMLHDGTGWPTPGAPELYVINFDDASRLREIERLSREDDLDLHRLARRCARLAALARGAQDAGLARSGAARLASLFYEAALTRWASEARTSSQVLGLITRLAGTASGILDAKEGDYDGLWFALRDAWAGDTPLARRARGLVSDPELRAVLERLCLETANHRGDVEASSQAWARFREIADRIDSILGLAESLRAFNVHHVTKQNRLPATRDDVSRLRAELSDDAAMLARRARAAAEISVVLPELRPVVRATDVVLPSETALWLAFDKVPREPICNREVGRCLGTAARTCAFLGEHDRAIDLALEARSCLGQEPRDLAFNATVLARILCDEARVHGHTRTTVVQQVLERAGCLQLEPASRAGKMVREQPGLRFTIDALLRALLWAPTSVPAALARLWRDEIRVAPDSSLYRALTEVRSHPSELVARHAGELCQGTARTVWFELSLALSAEATDGTIRRFGAFTEALREGRDTTAEPIGSLLSPTFEYR